VGLPNPFPGLRPFLDKEQHLFFGRESQVDTMIDKLAAHRFLTVVGTSGSGKSSLVNCGLKPALYRGLMASAGTAWRMAHFRPGSDPIKAMAAALVQPDGLFRASEVGGVPVESIIDATLHASKQGLVAAYQQAHLDPSINLLVIADQFEELFRYRNLQPSTEGPSATEEKAVAFVNLLLEAAASPLPIYVVITMRSDFLGDCAQFFGLPEAINSGQYLVPRMSRDERRSAIAGPVAVAGGEISPILLTRLVNDVGDNPDQLSILQHALNRTWAEWQRQGGIGPMDLKHYEAIGTMAHALDLHAQKAFDELQDGRQKEICEKVFQAITDKGTDARGIRRPTSAETLRGITGASLDELTAVLAVFRKPSRSFVMPPMGDAIADDTVIDISHESLMRVWNRLKLWVDDEADSASQYMRLVQNSTLHAKSAAGLMTDPELALTLRWKDDRHPNQVWGDRYRPGFEQAMQFLEDSRVARDKAVAEEKARQRRELRRTRLFAAVMSVAFLLTLGVGLYARHQKLAAIAQEQRAAQEATARQRSDEMRDAQQKLAEEKEKHNQELSVALDEATVAEAQAKAADARAETERQTVLNAVDAGTRMVVAENAQNDLDMMLQLDTEAKKDPAVIEREKQARDAATIKKNELRVTAGQKSAEAAALTGNARIINPHQMSGSDLFDVANGTVVTDWSGRGTAQAAAAASNSCGAFSAVTQNPTDMFSGSSGSACRATIFSDQQPTGTEHWVEWKTKQPVTVASVGLFAAHDTVRLRRSFSTFKFYVKKGGQWELIKNYSPRLSPALAYGGGCGSQPCLPAPAPNYADGNVLADCINVPSVTGQEFRATFVQWVSAAERFSGPRILQLDGYSHPDCKK
jgi:hypothetical protein